MTFNDEIDTDLRHWPAESWEFSRMPIKTNGRWKYFFEANSPTPFNRREPISYGETYTPPKAGARPITSHSGGKPIHPLRSQFLNKKVHSRAPLAIEKEWRRTQPIIPPAWRNSPEPIPEQKPPYITLQAQAARKAKPLYQELEETDQKRDQTPLRHSYAIPSDFSSFKIFTSNEYELSRPISPETIRHQY